MFQSEAEAQWQRAREANEQLARNAELERLGKLKLLLSHQYDPMLLFDWDKVRQKVIDLNPSQPPHRPTHWQLRRLRRLGSRI